jgi:hypothetical protein
LLLILIVVSALSVIVLTRYSRSLQQVFREYYDSAIYCDAMKDAMERLDLAAQRRIWGAPADSSNDVPAERAKFEENLTRQRNNVVLPGERELTLHLAHEWSDYPSP